MSSFYKNHIVTGETYKPLLHKKGKRWIVLGLSALSLLGLGTVSTGHISANASSLNNQSQGQSKASQMPAQQESTPKAISNQASLLHDKIVSNQAMYQHKTDKQSAGIQSSASKSNTSAEPSSASKPSASVSVPKVSIAPKSVSSNSNKGLNLMAAPVQKGSSKGNVSASNSNVTNTTSNSLSAVQSSFANNVNNKGMLGVSAKSTASSSAVKPNVPKSSVSASIKSSNADSIISNIASNSNSIKSNATKSASDSNSAKSGHALNLGVKKQLGANSSITKGTFDGANYTYDSSNGALEFTGGKLNWNSKEKSDNYNSMITDIARDSSLLLASTSDIKSVKIDSDVDTSNITDASGMFSSDNKLHSLILPSNFGPNITNANSMFGSNLYSLNLPSGFAPNITDAGDMFAYDTNLHSLNLPAGFGEKINDASDMFESDNSLQSLTLPSGFGQNITNASYMFTDNNNLQSITLPQGFGSKITNANNMFGSNKKLLSLNLPSGFGQKITNASDMFGNNNDLQSLNMPAGFGQNIIYANGMFNSDNLQSLTLPSGFGQNIINAQDMFGDFNGKDLTTLTLPQGFGSKITNANKMFNSDANLRSINLPTNFGQSIIDASYMFSDDLDLQSLTLPDGFGENINDASDIFTNDNDSDNLQSLILNNPSKYSGNFKQELSNPVMEPFESLYRALPQKDKKGNNYTPINPTNFTQGTPASGKYVFNQNLMPKQVTITIVKHHNNGTTTHSDIVKTFKNSSDNNSDSDSDSDSDISISPSDYTPDGYNSSDSNQSDSYKSSNVYTLPNHITWNYNQIAQISQYNVKFHDIYSDVDGLSNNVPKPTTISDYPNSTQSVTLDNFGWTLVNSQGQPVKSDQVTLNGNKVLNVAPIYDGLVYKYNKNNNSIEFTSGTLNYSVSTDIGLSGAPRYIKGTSSIKFDSDINNNTTDISSMFYGFKNLQSIDFGNNFTGKQITNMSNLFQDDNSLQHVTMPTNFGQNVTDVSQMFYHNSDLQSLTLPSGFGQNIANANDMFASDNKLQSLTLNNPNLYSSNLKKYLSATNDGGYNDDGYNGILLYKPLAQKDSNGKNYTTKGIDFTKGTPVTGKYVFNPNVKPQVPTVTINIVQRDSDGKTTSSSKQSVQLSGQRGMINPSDYQPAGYHIDSSDNALVWDANNIKSIPSNVTFNYTKPPKIQYVKVHFQDIYDGGSYWRDAHSDDPDGLESNVPKDATVKEGDQIGVPGSDALTNPNTPNGWALVNSDGFITNKPYARRQKNGNSQMIYVAPVYRGMTYRWSPRRGKLEFIAGKPTWNNSSNDSNNQLITANRSPKLVNINNVKDIHFDDHSITNRTQGVDFKDVTDGSYMLANLPNVQRIELPYTATNLSNASHMFANDNSLQRVASSKNDNNSVLEELPSLKDGSYMFANDPQLQGEIINSDVGQDLTNAQGMFQSDSGLTGDVNYVANPLDKYGHSYNGSSTITLPSNFGANITDASNMFNGTNLSNYYFPSQFGQSITDASGMYANDSRLHSVQMPDGFGNNINNTTDMFKGDNPNTQSGDFTQMELDKPSTYSSTFNNYLSNISHPFGTDGIANSYRVIDNQGHTTPAVDFSETNAIPGTYVFKDNEAVQQVRDRIHFINKNNHRIAGTPRGLVVKGNKGTQYTVQANQVPKGYKLLNDGTQTFKLDGHNHFVFVIPSTAPKQSNIPISSHTVNFTGTIDLHYHDGNKVLKDITLPYNIKTSNNHLINNLLNHTNPSATIPADYLNKVISQYNTKNFSYDNNVKSNEYSNVAVDPNVKGWTNQNTNNPIFHNGTITLNFSANNVNENVHYIYKSHNEGNTQFTGKNDESGIDSNSQGLKAGYHMDMSNPHNTWIYGNGGSDASGQYNDSDNVNVLPSRDTDTISYQYKGKQLASDKVNGNDHQATDASDTTYDVSSTNHPDMPSDYHLVKNDNTFGFDNGTHAVAILPDQATDTINYVNGKNTVGTYKFSGNNAGAKGASDTNFDVDKNNQPGLPNGYHLVNNDNKFNYDNNTHSVAVAPNKVTDTVDYQYKGNTKGSNQLTGNTSTAKDASDTTFDVTANSDKGMPVGYHLVNGNNKFSFNGTTHDVAITPNHASDTVNYQYDNQTMSSQNFGGNSSQAQGASDTSFDVNSSNDTSIPTGYHLVNKDNDFDYDGNQHNVAITPDQATDTIDYNNGNQTVNTQTFTGDSNNAKGAKNNTLNITPTNDKGLPQGYHLANNTNPFSYDGKTHVVNITPNQATDTIDYQYKGNTQSSHQFTGNDHTAKDASDTTVDINSNNDAGLPTGYHLVNKDNTFNYDNGTHNVAITPNKATDTVDYQYNNQTVGNTQLSGNTSTAQGASDTNFDIDSKNEPGLPSGYHLANKDNTFNYDGGTHNVVVEPNTATDIVDYNYGNKTVGNHDFSGNSSTAQGAKGTTFDVKSGNDAGLPNGYHLVNSDNTFNYDGTTHAVAVTPNRATDTVNYQYKGTTRGTNQLTGNSSQAQGASDTSFDVTPQSDKGMPQGYHLANNDNKFNFDGNSHNVAILPNNATDTVNYQYNGTTKSSHQFSGNSSQATGASDTNFDVNSDNEPDLPAGYHLVNKDNQFNYDGNQHNVAIAPDTASATINYDYGTKTINSHKFNGNSSTAQGASDNSLDITPTNDQGLPTGYHLVNNSNKFNYDNNSHSVAIAPNKDTNTVDYYLNDKSNVLGHNQFSGNDDKAQGASDTSFTVNSSDATGVPAGYHLVKPTSTFGFDNTTNYVQIAKNGGSAKVHYVLPDGSYVPASDDNGGNGTIHGTTGENVDPASQVPVPAGFTPVQSDLVNPNKPYNAKTNPINPYRFGPQHGETNPSDTIHVTPNRIKGTVTVHLVYNETNGKVDSTKNITYNIDNHVGDTFSDGDGDSDIDSAEYLQSDYRDDSNNASDAVPLDWRQAANGDNLNYHKTYNFTYTTISGGDVKIQYVDMDPGAVPVGNEKTDGNGHPIVGAQDLGNLGPVGTQVQLGAKGANDGNGVKDILVAPVGFYLEHDLNPLTVDIDANGNTINIGLGGSDDTTPGNVSMIK